MVIGRGYRLLREQTGGSFAFSISPARLTEHVLNAFVQDEIALGSKVQLLVGAKVERDAHVGWGLHPRNGASCWVSALVGWRSLQLNSPYAARAATVAAPAATYWR